MDPINAIARGDPDDILNGRQCRASGLAEETSKPHEAARANETKYTLVRISKHEDAHGVFDDF
ncbi:hypothetical protein [Bradyrhizobium sp. CB3481]|uniref:hypothetical protein n=1 Tax=Bradyrhizobium sp. CB3481 TaxID=3039158 RepID=UPI0024B165DE|nr:hypothetical protein [Bradyrhizobium sp. CB3481]WFU18858.1 hypothetical protein QA643_11230 [Bradyrhizobium sp. CB3481]